MPEHVRAYVYRLLTPIGALLTFYGLVNENALGLWLQLAGAALLVGEGALAARHTSTTRPTDY